MNREDCLKLMMNKPLAIADKPFKSMKINTSKKPSCYPQGQQYVGGMLLLFIVCLFTSCNTGKPGAPAEHGEATVPPGASTPTSAQAPGWEQQGDDSLAATSRALAPEPLPARGGEQQGSKPPLVEQLRSLASNPQIDQQPDKLGQLGDVLLELVQSKQAAGASHQDLSSYTDAAILYQHVLSICAQEDAQQKKILASPKAKELADSAY